jgi:histone H2B
MRKSNSKTRKPKFSSATKRKDKRFNKRGQSYTRYLFKVLKVVHPNVGISRSAMSITNSFVCDVLDKVCVESDQLCRLNEKTTLSASEIQTAIRLILPPELARNAVAEGTKAVRKYYMTT